MQLYESRQLPAGTSARQANAFTEGVGEDEDEQADATMAVEVIVVVCVTTTGDRVTDRLRVLMLELGTVVLTVVV